MEESNMKIKQIIISGMHKVDRKTYDFNDGVTYFIGDNGAGKSTILEAIQLGLLGYIPGYAKTNEAVMKHASGLSMSISLLLDSDITINRTWVRSGASVKSTLDVSNYDAKKIGDLVADIELPIFNFNEFKSMTSNKLKEWFIAFLPDASDDVSIKEELEKSVKGRALPYSTLLDSMMERASTSKLKGIELVKSMNNWIKEEQSYVKGQINKLQSTIESLVHYDDAPVKDPAEITARIAELTADMDKLARYESAKNIHVRALEAVTELKESLPSDCYSTDPRIKDMETRVKVLQEEINLMQGEFNTIQGEKLALVQEKGNISGIKNNVCPYTKTKCDTIAKLAEETAKKLAEVDEKIKAVDAKLVKCNSSAWKLKEDEKQRIISNMDFIRGQYDKLSAMEAQIQDPGESPTPATMSDMRAELDDLNKTLAMIRANERFDLLMDNVTKDKFARENDLEVLKTWDKVTGPNGLQTTLMSKPFEDLAAEMSDYLTKMFGQPTKAQFGLLAKANSFSFGLIRDDSYIEFDYLSSGERCLFTLALILCIMNRSKSPVRTIFIDDILDHLDESNSDYLFETLKTISGIQFIMAGVKQCKDTSICKAV